MSSQLDALTKINLDDLVASFGWENARLPAAVVRRLFSGPARKFAEQMVAYDDRVGQVGLHEASCDVLNRYYIHELCVQGLENLPASGPALILSNHPGMTDTISLFAAIPRAGLRVIALDRPFLVSLPHISRHLVYMNDDSGERMRAVRQIAAHLRAGGAALTFPAGKIEPDPEVHPGAVDSLTEWTQSSAVFMRLVPDLQIVPVLVSGVIWERTTHHWLTRFKHTREDRERLAAALQLLAMVARDERPTRVQVEFTKPITRQDACSMDPGCIHETLMKRMSCLIEKRKKEGITAG